jgi:RNA polymerase primary sigma factor
MKQLRIAKQITNRENESLDRYLNEIAKVDMVSVEMEVELSRRIREGDTAALEKLTKANLRFVVSVAKQYQNKGLSLSDLINEGNLGLIKAAQRFDETRGFKFISYAVWWIRQCILQALAEQVRIVRLPLNRIGAFQKLTRTLAVLEQKFQRDPSLDELAEASSLTPENVNDILENSGKGVALDAPVFSGEDMTLHDTLWDGNNAMPDELLIKASLDTEISRIIKTLSFREARVISLHFGLNGEKPMNLEEIGQNLSISRERVRQIKESAVRNLRKSCTTSRLKTYL